MVAGGHSVAQTTGKECTWSVPWRSLSGIASNSLCDLGELCLCGGFANKTIHHGDTEATEIAQRKTVICFFARLGEVPAFF
jgi:hypothetical protein